MRPVWLIAVCFSFAAPATAALYKHVDETGTVTYSDRPRQPLQEALNLPPPNVATPEARRQLELARAAWEQEERADYEARIRRSAAVQRAPAGVYSRPLGPATPRYGLPYYALPVYYVGYARISSQGNPPQGLRPAAVSHQAGHSRR